MTSYRNPSFTPFFLQSSRNVSLSLTFTCFCFAVSCLPLCSLPEQFCNCVPANLLKCLLFLHKFSAKTCFSGQLQTDEHLENRRFMIFINFKVWFWEFHKIVEVDCILSFMIVLNGIPKSKAINHTFGLIWLCKYLVCYGETKTSSILENMPAPWLFLLSYGYLDNRFWS